MNNTHWTEKELARLRDPLTNEELSKELKRTVVAVRLKRLSLKIEGPKTAEADKSYSEDASIAEGQLWKRRFASLNSKYERALHENSVVASLVGEIRDLAPTSYSPVPVVQRLRKSAKSQTQSAVLLLSDTHVGKVITREQTLNFGEYNFSIFLARLKYLEESIVSILENHTTTDVDELVVAMLGDMLDGALLHGSEIGQHTTLFAQFYAAGHAIAQFLRALSARVKKIRVKTVVGNHTRWGTQRKMPTENRFSNLDMFLYALVEALTKDIPSIEWDLNPQPFALFEVKKWVFHASHGDHLRGGDKALGIPNHAVGRSISTTTQLFNKHALTSPQYYVCGHLHREITLPHATGSVMVNGGFCGFDNYGLMESFNPVDASQRLFFVHPKFGKTAEYSLSLKFAEETKEAPYVVPAQFEVR